MSNYIIHYGILGMKWGKRNGPPYPLDSSTMSSSEKKAKRGKGSSGRWLEPTVKGGKDKPNISPAEKVTKETTKSIDEMQKIVDSVNRLSGSGEAPDLSNYSDDELRQIVNRLNLERQYASLNASDTISGFDKTKEILSIAGSTVAISGGMLAIASTIKELAKK